MTDQHTGEIHCIDPKFSIHELPNAVQDIQELLRIVFVSLSFYM